MRSKNPSTLAAQSVVLFLLVNSVLSSLSTFVSLNGQAVPPLCPAPLHHFLAVRRAHTLEKAVTGLSLAPVRLIRPLHLKLLWIGEARILCLIHYLVKHMSYFELLFYEAPT